MDRQELSAWIGDCSCVVAREDAPSLELQTVATHLENAAGHVRALAEKRRHEEKDAALAQAVEARIAKANAAP